MASTLRVRDLKNFTPAQKASGTFGVAPMNLEPTPEEMAELVRAAAERVVEHIATLSSQRASDTEGGREAAQAAMEPLPEIGQPLKPLLDLFFSRILPKGYNTA